MVAGVFGAKGWVETIPWCGRGFWSTMGGGPSGVVRDATQREPWTLALPFVGGLNRCKDISGVVEVDNVDGLTVYMVEPYWFLRV